MSFHCQGLPGGHILFHGARKKLEVGLLHKALSSGERNMSSISGTIIRKKKGRTISKLKIANKRMRNNKPQLIAPSKAAEFLAKLKALAKRYHIVIENLKIS